MADEVGTGYVDPARPVSIWNRTDPTRRMLKYSGPDPTRGSTRSGNNSDWPINFTFNILKSTKNVVYRKQYPYFYWKMLRILTISCAARPEMVESELPLDFIKLSTDVDCREWTTAPVDLESAIPPARGPRGRQWNQTLRRVRQLQSGVRGG